MRSHHHFVLVPTASQATTHLFDTQVFSHLKQQSVLQQLSVLCYLCSGLASSGEDEGSF
jgi:hypothetical protein